MATEALRDLRGGEVPAGSEPPASAQALGLGFRLAYVAKFALAIACGAVVAGAIVYALLACELGTYAENLTIIGGARRWVWGAAVLSALIQGALTGALVTALALFASHKIAGPLERLAGVFRGIPRGRLPRPVRFRQGDQVGRLERQANDVVQALRARHELLTRRLEEVLSCERELRRACEGPASVDERRAAARRLAEQAHELARLLASPGQKPEGAAPPQ